MRIKYLFLTCVLCMLISLKAYSEIPGNVTLGVGLENSASTSLIFDFDVNTFRYVSFGGGGMMNLASNNGSTLYLSSFQKCAYLQSNFHFIPIDKPYTYNWDPYIGVRGGIYVYQTITDIVKNVYFTKDYADIWLGLQVGVKAYLYQNIGLNAELQIGPTSMFYNLGVTYRL